MTTKTKKPADNAALVAKAKAARRLADIALKSYLLLNGQAYDAELAAGKETGR